MIYPGNRFQFSSQRKHKRRRVIIRSLILLLFVAAAAGILFFLNREKADNTVVQAVQPQEEKRDLSELWAAREYEKILSTCESRLLSNPMDPAALVFAGFTSFYMGAAQVTLEEKLPLLDQSIRYLRKARLIEDRPYEAEVDYVLGKAYYQKGKYYADLSASYIEHSLEDGYKGEDSYEYLGLAYSQLGKYEKSIQNFLRAAEESPSDILYHTLAKAYLHQEMLNDAEKYLKITLEVSEDISLQLQSRFLLGAIYSSRNEYKKAEEEYKAIISVQPDSADAHFSLGEVYDQQGDMVKARAEWRAALRINGNHYGARTRLYN